MELCLNGAEPYVLLADEDHIGTYIFIFSKAHYKLNTLITKECLYPVKQDRYSILPDEPIYEIMIRVKGEHGHNISAYWLLEAFDSEIAAQAFIDDNWEQFLSIRDVIPCMYNL